MFNAARRASLEDLDATPCFVAPTDDLDATTAYFDAAADTLEDLDAMTACFSAAADTLEDLDVTACLDTLEDLDATTACFIDVTDTLEDLDASACFAAVADTLEDLDATACFGATDTLEDLDAASASFSAATDTEENVDAVTAYLVAVTDPVKLLSVEVIFFFEAKFAAAMSDGDVVAQHATFDELLASVGSCNTDGSGGPLPFTAARDSYIGVGIGNAICALDLIESKWRSKR